MSIRPRLFLALAVAWPAVLAGQGTGGIRGKVLDRATGRGIAGALVSVNVRQLTVATRGDGSFVLNNVPGGSQQLQAAAIGYRPVEDTVTVQAGETREVRLTLAP